MKKGFKLMILAGSSEAPLLATRAQGAGALVRAVMTEPPRTADLMPVSWELLDFEQSNRVHGALAGCDGVLDASHGFDARLSEAGYVAARDLGLPHLCYTRPTWQVQTHKGCQSAADVRAAAARVTRGARVFCTTGWASLPDFSGFQGARLFLRQTKHHTRAAPFDFVDMVFGAAPFTVESETALFEALEIDTLICRNLGGAASWPKVDAAMKRGINVILVDRPPLPLGADVVTDVDAAMDWVKTL